MRASLQQQHPLLTMTHFFNGKQEISRRMEEAVSSAIYGHMNAHTQYLKNWKKSTDDKGLKTITHFRLKKTKQDFQSFGYNVSARNHNSTTFCTFCQRS